MNCMQKQSALQNKRSIGTIYEQRAVEYLVQKGYKIVYKNYRCKLGEIDLIAKIQEFTVFIEVKYKASCVFGFPRESVNYKKQQRILLTAKHYLRGHELSEVCCRFDVIEILGEELTHIENAF